MLTVRFNGSEHPVTETVLNSLLELFAVDAAKIYNEKLPDAAKIFASGFARKKLYDLERERYTNGMSKEEAQAVRPKKNQDAAERLLELLVIGLKDMLNYAEIRISTDDDGAINDLSYELKNTSQTRR